jgi:hypothetical protein
MLVDTEKLIPVTKLQKKELVPGNGNSALYPEKVPLILSDVILSTLHSEIFSI